MDRLLGPEHAKHCEPSTGHRKWRPEMPTQQFGLLLFLTLSALVVADGSNLEVLRPNRTLNPRWKIQPTQKQAFISENLEFKQRIAFHVPVTADELL